MSTVGAEGTMADPDERQRERELRLRREQELKDLETENTHGERPLEGLSSAPTTWTQDQDDREAERVHGDDELEAQARSLAQIPPAPDDRRLPARTDPQADREEPDPS
ncbi:hypothetical protein [Anaeromyxobacter sp. PSR-1]|uniref:hypothetical protein n=1 Tax=unclassified Anaeromyxobacter TaxID=2620896 RepID=UPI001ED99A2F|nr:hypothetical protein [Anaeromyxobacter sp. PSR-1]